MLGSRAVFYLYLISLLIIFLQNRKDNLVLIITTILSLTLVLFLFFSSSLAEKMLFNQGLAQDGSFLSRLDMLESAIYFFPDQLAYGGYYTNVEHYQSFGGYAHNILSAIQFYGLPFFLLLVFILMQKLRIVLFSSFTAEQKLFFYFSFLSLMFTNYIGYYFAWFVLGNILSTYEKNSI